MLRKEPILTFQHLRPPVPDDQDHVDPGLEGRLPGPAGHQRGLPAGVARRRTGHPARVRAEQQQKQRLLRAADLVRLERGRPEPGGHVVDRHDLYDLGPGDGPAAGADQSGVRPRQDAADCARQGGVRYCV